VGQAISEVLPLAVGVAISPVPIIAVILVLFSARARVNGPVFLAGWVAGVAVISVVAYLLSDASDASTDDTASDTVSWIKLVLGVLLVLLAVRNWRQQSAGGEHAPPKWMASIDTLTPAKTGGLALLLSGINPKNLALSLAAGSGLTQIGATRGEAAVGLIVFIVIASASIAVPVVFYLVGGDRAARVLDGWKSWLSTHNAAVMAVLFLVFGFVLFSEGLRGLTA
jgi:Sap, sulfolipid-1-addressing protein